MSVSPLAAAWAGLNRRTAVAAATFVAALTCLTTLWHQPLSWDEAVTVTAAEHQPTRLLALLGRTDAPLGFYYVLMHGWIRLLDGAGILPTEAWLRLPSALAAVVTVALVAWLTSDWYGPKAGLLAGTLLAIYPLFVFYAQDARPYTLATMLTVAATMLFEKRRPVPWTIVAVLAVYAHLFAVLVLMVHGVIAVKERRWRWLLAGVVVAVAAAPLVWVASHQTGEIGWIPKPTPRAVASVLTKLAGGAGVAFALVALAVATGYRRRIDGRSALVLGWLLVPPVLLILADFVTPVLVARYALVAVPAVAIAVAAAYARRRNRFVAGFTVAVLVAAAVTTGIQQTRPYKYEDYRAALNTIDATARSGDALLFLPVSARVGYIQYAGDHNPAPAVSDVALLHDGHPNVADRIGGYEVGPDVLARRLRAYQRIFLVGDPLSVAFAPRRGTDEVKQTALRDGYTLAWTRAFGVMSVSLFVRR
jgi:mannosyltransferase